MLRKHLVCRPAFEVACADVASAVATGTAAQIFIVGAPGVGKTTLLQHVVAAVDDVRIHSSTACETDSTTPYAISRQLFGADGFCSDQAAAEQRFAELTAEFSRRGPTILVVDNAQSADRESLDLLHRLIVVGRDLPLVVVAAFTPLPTRSSLSRMRAIGGSVRTIELGAFTRAEVSAAVACRGRASAQLTADILESTGGNPYLVARALERGRRPDDSSGAFDAEIAAYVDLLDPSAREVVDVVAAAGGPLLPATLSTIRGQAPTALVTPLAAGVSSGLLVVTETGEVDCASEVHRRVVIDAVQPAVRTLLDEAIAYGLVHGGGTPEQISRHQARRGSAPASRHAVSIPILGSFDTGELDAAVTSEPDVAHVVVLAESGRFAEAAAAASRLRDTAMDAESRLTLLFAELGAALFAADPHRSRSVIDEIRLHRLTPETIEWLRLLPVWLDDLNGRHSPRTAYAAPAGEAPLPGFTLDTIGVGIHDMVRGDCVRALADFERGETRNRHDSPVSAERPLQGTWARWAALHAYGPTAAAGRRLPNAVVGSSMSDLWLIPMHHSVSAEVCLALGRFDDAAHAANEALDAARRTGWALTSMAAACLASVHVHRGDLDRADETLASWRRESHPLAFGFPDPELVRAEIDSARGRHGAAARRAQSAWQTAVRSDCTLWLLRRAPTVLRLATQADDAALRDSVTTDLARLSASGAPALATGIDLCRALQSGDLRAADAAADGCRMVGDTVGELAALEEIACSYAASDLRDPARATADRAMRLADRIGSPTSQIRIRARMGRYDIRFGSTAIRTEPAIGWASLTRSERRIAELVSSGRTSTQIAEQLGISPRTVQTHVSHALAKLGLTSRTQLAAEAVRVTGTES